MLRTFWEGSGRFRIWKSFPRHASCNPFIAGAIATLCRAIVFSEKVSVPPETLLEIISNSALNAPSKQAKGKSILTRIFAPRFHARHRLKDVNRRQGGVQIPTIDVAKEMLSKAVEMGFGRRNILPL